MIVDAHTHVFPPEIAANRDRLLELEPTFAELYSNPRARLATADQLLEAMAERSVDKAVIAGFAWRDASICREHNDYLLRAAEASKGQLLPFCNLPLGDTEAARLEVTAAARGGARGIGELRPESQGSSLSDPETAALLAWAYEAFDLPLLFHASEPVGHVYPGKAGQAVPELYDFVRRHEEIRVIAAHWGGGLPLYALMPEVKIALTNVWVDTAATTLLYDPSVFRVVADLIGPERILFGSDYPLLSPKTQIDAIERAPLTADERRGVLGDNAALLLRLHG